MELDGYVEAIQAQFAITAAAAGKEGMELAERLTGSLNAAARLVLQDAVSDAAQEITRDLAPGSVEVRLRGRELTFVVTLARSAEDAMVDPDILGGRGSEPAGDSATSRISFRPPDHLKARIEDAAEREGLSVNAFLVRTLSAVLDPAKAPSARLENRGATRVDGWFR